MAHQTVTPTWDEELVPTPNGRVGSPSPECPVEVSLAAISGRWTTLLLRELMSGDARTFTELSQSLPNLSNKVLTERLTELVDAGLVVRTVSRGFPCRNWYRITARGLKLRPLLLELYRTGLALQSQTKLEP